MLIMAKSKKNNNKNTKVGALVFVFVFALIGLVSLTQTFAASRGKPKAEITLSSSSVQYGDPLTATAMLNKSIDAGYVNLICYKGKNTVLFDGGYVQRGDITKLQETFDKVGGSLAWPDGDAECEVEFYKYDDAKYRKQLIDSVTFTVQDNR